MEFWYLYAIFIIDTTCRTIINQPGPELNPKAQLVQF